MIRKFLDWWLGCLDFFRTRYLSWNFGFEWNHQLDYSSCGVILEAAAIVFSWQVLGFTVMALAVRRHRRAALRCPQLVRPSTSDHLRMNLWKPTWLLLVWPLMQAICFGQAGQSIMPPVPFFCLLIPRSKTSRSRRRRSQRSHRKRKKSCQGWFAQMFHYERLTARPSWRPRTGHGWGLRTWLGWGQCGSPTADIWPFQSPWLHFCMAGRNSMESHRLPFTQRTWVSTFGCWFNTSKDIAHVTEREVLEVVKGSDTRHANTHNYSNAHVQLFSWPTQGWQEILHAESSERSQEYFGNILQRCGCFYSKLGPPIFYSVQVDEFEVVFSFGFWKPNLRNQQ